MQALAPHLAENAVAWGCLSADAAQFAMRLGEQGLQAPGLVDFVEVAAE